MKEFTTKVLNYLLAGYPCLSIRTLEEINAVVEIKNALDAHNKRKPDRTKVIFKENGSLFITPTVQKPLPQRMPALFDPKVEDDNQLYLLVDILTIPLDKQPAMARHLKEAIMFAEQKGSHIILIDVQPDIPKSFQHLVTPLDYDLPDENEISEQIDRAYETYTGAYGKFEYENKDRLVGALKGMTSMDIGNSLYLSAFSGNHFDFEFLQDEKVAAIKKTGHLELVPYQGGGLELIGGLDRVKYDIGIRKASFSKEAREYGLEKPKGILLTGIAGCGKSQIAKLVGQFFQMPTVRFDLSKCKGSLVGESTKNLNAALQQIEKLAPVVVFCDEVEKALAGSQGGDLSGVSREMLGVLLTWMNDHTSDVFMIATTNKVTELPPELLRKGRFDEIYFVDFPTEAEREEIYKIHIAKRGRDPKNFNLSDLVKATEGFTGSEIEDSVKTAMARGFSDGKREFTTEDILFSVKMTKPLKTTKADEIALMQKWGHENAVSASAEVPTEEERVDQLSTKGRRKV